MRYLAFDIGAARTGVAFLDTAVGIPLPLETIKASLGELPARIENIARERDVTGLVLGLPLLPSGKEGSQVTLVRSVAENLETRGFAVHFVDERYTTPRAGSRARAYPGREPPGDPDARAACALLEAFRGANGAPPSAFDKD
jgi:putative Holliday junction resolvase